MDSEADEAFRQGSARSRPSPTRQNAHLNGCFTPIPARKPTRSVEKNGGIAPKKSAVFRTKGKNRRIGGLLRHRASESGVCSEAIRTLGGG